MSQVRKLQGGGTPSTKPKGKLIFDDTKQVFEGDEALNRSKQALDLDSDRNGYFHNIVSQAIATGHNVHINPTNGAWSVADADGNDISSQYEGKGRHAKLSDSKFAKRTGATFGTRVNDERISIRKFVDNFNRNVETPDNRKEFWRGSGAIELMDDPKNKEKRIYDPNHTSNTILWRNISSALDAVLSDNFEKDYKFSNYKNYQSNLENIKGLKGVIENLQGETLEEKKNNYINYLRNQYESGNVRDADEVLSWFGIGQPSSNESELTPEQKAAKEKAAKEEAENAKRHSYISGSVLSPELADKYGIGGIYIGDDGKYHVSLTDDYKFKDRVLSLSGDTASKIFGTNSPLYNGYIYGGNFYLPGSLQTDPVLRDASKLHIGNNAPDYLSYFEGEGNSNFSTLDELSPSAWNSFNYQTDFDKFSNGRLYNYLINNSNSGELDNIAIKYLDDNTVAYFDPNNLKDRDVNYYPNIHYINLERGTELTPEEISEKLSNIPQGIYSSIDPNISKWGDAGLGQNQALYYTYSPENGGEGQSVIIERTGDVNNPLTYKLYKKRNNGSFYDDQSLIDPSALPTVEQYIKGLGNGYSWNDIEKLFSKPTTKSPKNGKSKDLPEVVLGGYHYYKDTDGTLIPKRRNGGTIDWDKINKYQWGGVFSSSQNLNVDNELKNGIQQAHTAVGKSKGEDGGLTQAEQLQLAGAIADLTGVAGSFLPGVVGGVAGIGAGLTGTGLKFAGDIKRDGLDWRDVTNLGINAAFDLAALPASLIPGADNALKTSKFVKTVKSIGQPILKWAGTIGLASSAKETLKKIINGEKYTSEDLTNLVQGLAGGIVAGKQWSKQIGDAKLAAKLSKQSIKEANANWDTAKPIKIKAGNEEIDLNISKKQVADLVDNANGSPKKLASKVADFVKSNTGKELSDDEAKKVVGQLSSLGAEKTWKGLRISGPKQEQPTEAITYFLRSGKRNKALGNDIRSIITGKASKSLLGNVSEDEYRLLVQGNPWAKDFTVSGALRRAALNNPDQFNFDFTGVNTAKAPWQFGWRTNYRTVAPEKILGPQDGLPGKMGSLWPTSTSENADVLRRRQAIADWKAQRTPKVTETALVPVKQPELPPIESLFKAGVQVPTSPTAQITAGASYLPTVSGARGLATYTSSSFKGNSGQARIGAGWSPKDIPTQNTLLGIEKLATYPEFTKWANSHPEEARALMAELRNKFTNNRFRNASSATKNAYFNRRLNEIKVKAGWRFKKGGIIPKMVNGGFNEDPFGKNLKLSPILDLSSAVAQSLAIGRSYDWQREANAEMKKRQFQAPQLVQQRLDLSPIEHKYQLAEEPLRKFKHVSSDNFANLAGGLSVTEQLSGIGMQKGAEISDYINRYNQQYVNTENQQRQLDTQVANEKSAYLTNLNSREKLLNAQELNDKWANVWNTYSQQARQNVRDAENKIAETNYEFDMQNALNSYNLGHDTYIKDSNIYKAWLDEKKTNDKIDPFETWVTNSNNNYLKYKELLEKEKGQQHYLDFLKKRKELDQTYSWLLHMKKGGKFRPTNEELVLQGDKFAKRAVIRMNDHLQKMLLQLMK